MIQSRSAWMAARARNAARQGWWIALGGALAITATIAVLILVPRAADVRLQQRVAAIVPAPDSLPIVHRIDSLRARLATLAPRVDSTVADTVVLLPAAADSLRRGHPDSANSASITDLRQRIVRARNAPLAESFRALASHPSLRQNRQAVALVDSIDRVDREREAHAALGGPGARYAALTNRLMLLGRALVNIAESQIPPVPKVDSTSRVAARVDDSTRSDSARALLAIAQALTDSVRQIAREATSRQLTIDSTALQAVRAQQARANAERERLESGRLPMLPPTGIVAAALVIGLAAGFLMVLLREIRRPTIGDLEEIRRVVGAPVVWHTVDAPIDNARRAAKGVGRASTLIDRESDTFTVAHLALSGVGDVVPQVDVISDVPELAAAVALSTAAVAASESRAVLVLADGERIETRRMLATLVGVTEISRRAPDRADVADAVLHEMAIDRDTHFDVLLSPPQSSDARAQLLNQYDLRLVVSESSGASWTKSNDVIVVARRGRTSLAWLTTSVAHAKTRGQRIRAMIVWSRPVPRATVGR